MMMKVTNQVMNQENQVVVFAPYNNECDLCNLVEIKILNQI